MTNPFKTEITRINGYLKEVITVFDDSGKPITQVINPIMVELKPRDILQIIVGSFLIASPLCFTEEVWKLSEELSLSKVNTLTSVSLLTVTLFVYFNFYRDKLIGNVIEFVKRIVAMYVISLGTVAIILYLIDRLPYDTDPIVAFKRTVIIGFPAIFGATISDYIK